MTAHAGSTSGWRQKCAALQHKWVQSGSAIDNALRGPGYPTPIVPVALLPDDKLTKIKKQYAEMGGGRDNTRFGWMRTKG